MLTSQVRPMEALCPETSNYSGLAWTLGVGTILDLDVRAALIMLTQVRC